MQAQHDERNPPVQDEERRIREAALDETIEATFPASDPPSTIPNPRNLRALRNRSE